MKSAERERQSSLGRDLARSTVKAPVNSPEAKFQAQTDIYQTEINNFQRERKRHETWDRENFEQHEFDQTIFNNREY